MSNFILLTILAYILFQMAYASRATDALSRKRVKGYSGTATWFVPSTQGGSIGACGPVESDDAQIVALNAVQYGELKDISSFCGKTVKITHGGKTVTAIVNDACPECAFGDLDLTHTVFESIGDPNAGRIAITWEFV